MNDFDRDNQEDSKKQADQDDDDNYSDDDFDEPVSGEKESGIKDNYPEIKKALHCIKE